MLDYDIYGIAQAIDNGGRPEVQPHQPVTDTPAPHIPGEPGVWILVMGDMFVFALLFGTVAYYRMDGPEVFHASQASLNQALGLTNTFALLTSSLCVVLGLNAARERRGGRGWITLAMVLGAMFVGFKLLEYAQKGGEGLLPDTNMFFMLYFVLTGMHLGHVLLGLLALFFMRRAIDPDISPENLRLVECCAIFWHMVDVLWVILFAIFYLHR